MRKIIYKLCPYNLLEQAIYKLPSVDHEICNCLGVDYISDENYIGGYDSKIGYVRYEAYDARSHSYLFELGYIIFDVNYTILSIHKYERYLGKDDVHIIIRQLDQDYYLLKIGELVHNSKEFVTFRKQKDKEVDKLKEEVKKLTKLVNDQQNQIDTLIGAIKYIPGGPEYQKAFADFNGLSNH